MNDNASDPGERRPGRTRRLDRAPGDRFLGGAPGTPTPGAAPDPPAGLRAGAVRALAAAAGAAAAGALLFFALGLLELGAGLIAPAAAVGWAVALALLSGGARRASGDRRTQMVLAATLGAAAIVIGFLLNWAWARGEGGVLDPLAYMDQRWGPLALVDVLAAAVAGALRAR